MAETFSAVVDAWVQKAEKRAIDTVREAAELLDLEVARPTQEGGNLPVVTGNLRRSRAASTVGMPPILWRQKEFKGSDAAILSVIQGAPMGSSIWIGFQAPYATKVEDKRGFVRLAAQRWSQIVERAVANVKSRSGGE